MAHTLRVEQQSLKGLHPDDVALFALVKNAAFSVANNFAINLRVCEPKRRPNGARFVSYTTTLDRKQDMRIGILIREKGYADDGGRWRHKPHSPAYLAYSIAEALVVLKYGKHLNVEKHEPELLQACYAYMNVPEGESHR